MRTSRCALAVLAAAVVVASCSDTAAGPASPTAAGPASPTAAGGASPTAARSVVPTGQSAGAATAAPAPSHPATASPRSAGRASRSPAAVNALTRTGPSTAVTVPDMQPVVTGAAPSLPATVTDARGQSVTISHAKRVICLDLYGTLTDTVIGLGLGGRLVGRARSDTQESLEDLPVVSEGGINLNVEAVLALHPDAVLTNLTIGSKSAYHQLESAGVTVVRFDTVPSIKAIGGAITNVGAVFGMTTAAHTLADTTARRLRKAQKAISGLEAATPRPPRGIVLYARGTGSIFFILGADWGASDVLHELGLADVAGEAGITDLKPANAEALAGLNPEIILTMTGGVASAGGLDAFLARPGMAATTAGRNRRIVMASDSQLLSYGPRTPANLEALADAIYTHGAGS